MRGLGAITAGLVCFFAAAGCGASGDAHATASAAAAGTTTMLQTVVGGVTRSYSIYRPATLPHGKLPLMIALQGGGSNASQYAALTGFNPVADQKGFLVAYPEPIAGFWHAGCCTPEIASADDLVLLRQIIDRLTATSRVDPDRVYVTGFSLGAAMAYRVGCELASRIAGFGAVGGSEHLSKPCHPGRAVTVYDIHGTLDAYQGGCGGKKDSHAGCTFGQKGYAPSVVDLNQQWRTTDACRGAAKSTTMGVVTQQTWTACAPGSAVRQDTIAGGSHCWPTLTSCGNFNASLSFWNFLSSHRRPHAVKPPVHQLAKKR